MVNNTNLIHCDQDTKEQTESFLDLKDNTLLKMKKEPGISSGQGDLEAGEIRIIIETIDTFKNRPLKISKHHKFPQNENSSSYLHWQWLHSS